MSYIKHADFTLKPIDKFITDYVYIWKESSSTVAPDGIIRLPFRIHLLASNLLFGPTITTYVYFIFVIGISITGFYLLLKQVIGIQSKLALISSSIFFGLNPIFLGNSAKLGLQFGIACLPFIIVALNKYHVTKKQRYLLVTSFLLVASMVHPFTFFINLMIAVVFAAKNFRAYTFSKVVSTVLITVALTAYAWVPLVALGSVSKSQLETGQVPNDYTSLVDVANTNGIFESITMSKSVLADFAFYSGEYGIIFVLSNLLLLGLIAFRLKQPNITRAHKKIILLSVCCFLFLVLAADISNSGVRTGIVWLIQTPIGWAFRSPLKWQLYLPFFVFLVLAISLNKPSKYKVPIMLPVLMLSFTGMNVFVGLGVYKNLLQPKQISHFKSFYLEDLDQKRLLYVRDYECAHKLKQNPSVNSEINYIIETSGAQTTYASSQTLEDIDITSFDYVFNCTSLEVPGQDTWKTLPSNQIVRTYKTRNTNNAVATTSNFGWAYSGNVLSKLQEIIGLDNNVQIIPLSSLEHSNGEAYELLNNVSKASFYNNAVHNTITLGSNHNNIKLLSDTGLDDEHLIITNNNIEFNQQQGASLGKRTDKKIPTRDSYNVAYKGSGFNFENLVPNNSFEAGLWQAKVGDCYRYDNQSYISMSVVDQSYDNNNALKLSALKHLACTKTNPITINSGGNLFFSVKALSLDGGNVRYILKFNDLKRTSFGGSSTPDRNNNWLEYTKFIKTPAGATTVEIYLYAAPVIQGLESSSIIYDDVFLTETPDIVGKLYLTASSSEAQNNLVTKTSKTSPTKYTISLDNTPSHPQTYLSLKERYHDGWVIQSINGFKPSVGSVTHIKDSFGNNAWRLDGLNDYGTDISIVVNFSIQEKFVLGSKISLGSALILAGITVLASTITRKKVLINA